MDCYLALTGGKILFIPIAIGIKRFGRKAGIGIEQMPKRFALKRTTAFVNNS